MAQLYRRLLKMPLHIPSPRPAHCIHLGEICFVRSVGACLICRSGPFQERFGRCLRADKVTHGLWRALQANFATTGANFD